MRKVERAVYNYSELSDKAKEKAHYSWCSNTDYPWHCENGRTVATFAEELGFTHAEIGRAYEFIKVLNNDEMTTKKRLRGKGKRFVRNLAGLYGMFTGYWLDCVIVDALKEHCKVHPFDLKAAVIDALQNVEKAIQQDIDDCYSQESFADHCDANEYEFFADGTQYHAE